MRAQQRRFADGRLHLHDGPIDLIIEAFGGPSAIEDAYAAAWVRFTTILDELCTELPLLRADPLGAQTPAGLLALGSVDRDRFHPGMSTEFLQRMGELITDALLRS